MRAPVIGSIGRLEPRKGHDTLIRAMPAILRQSPGATLLIAGHDPENYAPTLERLIRELDLARAVRLVGFQHDVPAFLHGVDVFAFASRFEGFGQVVVEAMAAARPVVASRIAPLTEIVVDGETGTLAALDDPGAFAEAIGSLLADPDTARRLGRQGRERVRTAFSADRMTGETLRVYAEHVDG